MQSNSLDNVTYYDALAGAYDLFFDDLEQNMQEEGRWLERLLRAHGVCDVLDASCGTGRQAIPLSERGFAVTAADPSQGMLRRASSVAAAHHVEISFINASFSELPDQVPHRFDAVIALGNGLCHLERPADIQTALAALRRCCVTGGLCLVGIKDFEHVRAVRNRFHCRGTAEHDTTRTLMFELWDFEDPLLVCTAVVLQRPDVVSPWNTHTASTREYMLEEAELARLASAAGFGAICRLHHRREAVFLLRPKTDHV